MGDGTIMPGWLGLALGGSMMLIVAAHLLVLQSDSGPVSRRRIRQVNGALMLLLIPLLTAGFAFIDHNTHPGPWVMTWLAAIFLLAFVIFFALLDAMNTARIRRATHRRNRERILELRRQLASQARKRSARTEIGEQDG